SQLNFSFRADGRSVERAETVGEGKLTVTSPDPKQGAREVTAGQFVMAFDDLSRLSSLLGLSGTRMKFHPPAGTPPGIGERESSSERLDARFNPVTEALDSFAQLGSFAYKDGERQASAARADYAPQSQLLTLTGHPQVWDSATRTRADRVLLHLDTYVAEGIDNVQATHIEPGDSGQRAGGAGAGPDPGVAPEASSTHVLADRVRAERSGQLVHYEGHVRAWHGADVIESAALDYHGSERRLSTPSSVLTSHLAPAARAPGAPATAGAQPGRATRPLTIRADHLEFFDQGRKANYRGDVQLETESTTMRSDRMDVYFSSAPNAGGSEVERVAADGHVRVTQPQRRAAGDHADYEAAAGKILLKGGPPTLYDEAKGFTTGQSLTFFTRDDTLSVDGGAQSPTLSKRRVAQ
ncbi:MAG TPA: LptA/OstA family protein, partial [Terriglobia bacterium]|nr:LptA/OstA family protein [Terriglobia bacterium]